MQALAINDRPYKCVCCGIVITTLYGFSVGAISDRPAGIARIYLVGTGVLDGPQSEIC